MLGAAGKSAQIPLYIWLPDAMEGPTPVSALIHAATMVTAGIYMVARCHALFDSSPARADRGCRASARPPRIFAASIGMVQHDIKRVLAYSTISQLGYMFLACGVGAYAAGIFHLLTHAFFKALLFLAAGSVIHALCGEQDMRKMGGLRTRIPITFWTMSAGVFAIAGIPPFAGFFSKDEILYQHLHSAATRCTSLLWLVGLLTAGMTSFYMFRLWFKTFFGEPRMSNDRHASTASRRSRVAMDHAASRWSCLRSSPSSADGSASPPHSAAITRSSTSSIRSSQPARPRSRRIDRTGHGLELTLAAVSVLVALRSASTSRTSSTTRSRARAAALADATRPPIAWSSNKYWVDEILQRTF